VATKSPPVQKNGAVSSEAELARIVKAIEIPRLEEHHAVAQVRGLSPLIVHRFTEKARKQMEDKQTGKASGGKQLREPEKEARDAAYVVPGQERASDGTAGKYCVPAAAFKHAFLYGVAQLDDKTKFPKSRATGWFMVADDPILEFESMVFRSDVGRIAGGTPQHVYRPQFNEWGCQLIFTYNTISLEQAVALLDRGGRQGGIGDWRPSAPKNKTGSFGRFEVLNVDEL
jgi:hypothetical protein